MQKTRTARLLLASAGVLVLYAYVARTLLPALVAVGVVLFHVLAHRAAARGFAATKLEASREMVEPVLHLDDPATMVTTMEGVVGAGITVDAEDGVPEGSLAIGGTLGSLARGRVPEGWRTTLAFTERGVLDAGAVTITLTDARGMFQTRRTLPAPLALRVHASSESFRKSRILAHKEPLEATTAHPLGLVFKEFEFEGLRPWAPGDRLRDVDWKSVSRFNKILTKTFERELEATVIILIDASRTMRARVSFDGGIVGSKLDHAAELTFQTTEVANKRSYAVGIIVHDEGRVLAELPPSRDPSTPRRVADLLVDLPGNLKMRRRPDVGAIHAPRPDLMEQAFLRRVGGFGSETVASAPRSRTTSGIMEAVVRATRRRASGSLFTIVLSDLEVAPDATMSALGRLGRQQHRILPVILPGSSYLQAPTRPRARDFENAYREEVTRDRSARTLQALRAVPVFVHPEATGAAILAASRTGHGDRGRGARGRQKQEATR